jgi:MarR family transcriptional regulator, organic hydroperoxide resistance regulator
MERFLDKILGHVGVSRGQWYFLRALWVEDGLTQRELSDRVGMKAPTTVLALKGMENSKLVYRVREKGDLRKVRVFLTEAGHGLRNMLLPKVKSISERATAKVAPQDLATFLRVLEQIADELRAAEDRAPLVFDFRPFKRAPCWKIHPAKPTPGTVSGQSAASRSEALRNHEACAVCFAASHGGPRCPPRAA